MDITAIRDALGEQPFKPFAIRLADGRSLPVPHREFVAVGPRRIIVVAEDDSWSVIEPILIVSLDYAAGKGKGGNGSSRRRRPDA